MTVHLNNPMTVGKNPELESYEDTTVTGYVIVIGVNAPDVATAVQDAHAIALRPKQEDGEFHAYDGYVEEVDASRMEKNDWDPYILEHATRIDQPGVYYSTGLIFFNHDEPAKKWWQFWR